jgi:hypothetical protein
MARSVDPPRVVNIADLRRLAKSAFRSGLRLHRWRCRAEVTMRENSRAFET